MAPLNGDIMRIIWDTIYKGLNVRPGTPQLTVDILSLASSSPTILSER